MPPPSSALMAAVSPLVGLVPYLTEVELQPGDPDVFVAAALGADIATIEPNATMAITGSGAGLTWEDAAGAAVGECLERYATATPASDLKVESYASLIEGGCAAHEPSSWALFEATQELPARYPHFSEDVRIAWTRGRTLANETEIYLPACLVYLTSGSVLRVGQAELLGPAISTGCACAATEAESALKGMCELIERDAFMIVWRNKLAVPEVELDGDFPLRKLFNSRFARPGLEYRIWYTTLDFGIPSFFGLLLDRRGGRTRTVAGGAAHPNRDHALLKTLMELVQGLNWVDYMGMQDHAYSPDFADIRTFTDRARLYSWRPPFEACDFLLDRAPRIPVSAIGSTTRPTAAALTELTEVLVEHGYEPAIVDLTTADVRELGYVVTRVMVPGLETMEGDHRLQMLGGRRWQEVPVRLGLATRPRRLSEINPFPHPYP